MFDYQLFIIFFYLQIFFYSPQNSEISEQNLSKRDLRMLLNHLYQQAIISPQFIKKQLDFQKQKYQKKQYQQIYKKCAQPIEKYKKQHSSTTKSDDKEKLQYLNYLELPQNIPKYHDCAKMFKQRIKHFGLLSELMVEERKKELKREIESRCLDKKNISKKANSNQQTNKYDEQKLIKCISSLTQTKLLNHYKKDMQFLTLSREQILKNS